MSDTTLKVGELARRTGLTVRTLHHYEAVGLIKASLRTESGHRLYAAEEIARLQQVLSLRQLGFSLEEIRNCLERRSARPLEVIRLHVARLREQIALQEQLVTHLEALSTTLEAAGRVSADDLLRTIEVMKMTENYYTPEQMEYLKQRREAVGEDRMAQAPKDWERLMSDVRMEMDAGSDPASPQVQELARRWQALIDEFTGGDPGIAASLKKLWDERGEEISQQHQTQYDPAMMQFMGQALAVLNSVK